MKKNPVSVLQQLGTQVGVLAASLGFPISIPSKSVISAQENSGQLDPEI